MKLTVLSVAFPMAPVARDTAGGAEQVLFEIDRALVRAGHRSIVIACTGSRTAGILIESGGCSGTLTPEVAEAARSMHRAAIREALLKYEVDLVHMHGLDFHTYLPEPGVPVLATLHLPLSFYPDEALVPARPGTYLNCVSASQRRSAPQGVRLLPDIGNGVPAARLRTNVTKRDFVMCLGRVCPEKGFHIAIEAAKRCAVPIVIGGEVYNYPEHLDYYSAKIAPHIGKSCFFAGRLGFERKRRLLGAARCLIVPSLVAETGCLAAMEALACGTPVVAFPNGALADVIDDGRTGFIVRDLDEMCEAIEMASTIKSEECRRDAEERFQVDVMLEKYINTYELIIKGGRPGREPYAPAGP